MSKHFSLLPAERYYKALVRDVGHAKHRINIMSLVLIDDDATSGLIDSLCDAAKRGVEVSIGLDVFFSYREIVHDSSRFLSFGKQIGTLRAMRKRLEASGAEVRWLGLFGATIFSRRTHIKWSIVDDTVYSFGGVNLYQEGIASADYMLCTTSHELAERMSKEHYHVLKTDREGRGYKSHLFNTPTHAVLVDGGRLGDSIIYRHAENYAREAKRIVYVSQYCPTGKLAHILKKNPDNEIYFNSYKNLGDIFNHILIRFTMKLNGTKTRYRGKKYLHAKFMIFELPNGETIAITGSHNFHALGGLLGTREVAMQTTDPHIIAELQRFLENHVKTAPEKNLTVLDI